MPKRHQNTSHKKTYLNLLLSLILLAEMVRHQTAEATLTKNHDRTITSAAPDFFVGSSGIVTTNPTIASISQLPITIIDAALAGKITSEEKINASSLCDEAIHDLLRENTWIPRGQLLDDIKNKRLKIFLSTPKASYSSSSIGSYDAQKQVIIVFYKQGLNKGDYKKAFLNELMSHLVTASHRRCGIAAQNINLLTMPFLKKDGTICEEQKKQLNEAIHTGINRVNSIKTLWERRKEMLSHEENHLLIQFLSAVKHYQPQTFQNLLSELGGEKGLKMEIDRKIYHRDGDVLEAGPNFPKGNPFFRGKIQGDRLIYHHTRNIHTVRGRIQAFLGDFTQIQTSIKSANSPYVHLGEDQRLSEIATFIAQFPMPILELFFQEFLWQTKPYLVQCSSLALKNPPPAPVPTFMAANTSWFFKPPPGYTERLPQYKKIPPKPQPTRDRPRQGRGPR